MTAQLRLPLPPLAPADSMARPTTMTLGDTELLFAAADELDRLRVPAPSGAGTEAVERAYNLASFAGDPHIDNANERAGERAGWLLAIADILRPLLHGQDSRENP